MIKLPIGGGSVAAGESSAAIKNANVIYLSEGGSDTTGSGAITAPYRTVNKAVAIINASGETDWAVQMGPGTYTLTTVDGAPVPDAGKRIAWVGAGKGVSTLRVYQAEPEELTEATSAPVLRYQAFVGVTVESDIVVVQPDEDPPFIAVAGAGTVRSAVGDTTALIANSNLTGGTGSTLRVESDGDVILCTNYNVETGAPSGGTGVHLISGCDFDSEYSSTSVVGDVVEHTRSQTISADLATCCIASVSITANEVSGGSAPSVTCSNIRGGFTMVQTGTSRLTMVPNADGRASISDVTIIREAGGVRNMVAIESPSATPFYCDIRNVTVRCTAPFEEASNDGTVSVFFLREGNLEVTVDGLDCDSTAIPFMVSHVSIDPDRTTVKNLTIRDSSITFTRAADAGPADRNSCIVASNRGTILCERVTFTSTLAASTNTTNGHAPISWTSDTGASDGTAILIVRDCIFDTTLPAAANAESKASVAFLSESGTETVAATFENITVKQDANLVSTFTGAGGARLAVRGVLVSNTAVTFANAPTTAGYVAMYGNPVVESASAWRTALELGTMAVRNVAMPVISVTGSSDRTLLASESGSFVRHVSSGTLYLPTASGNTGVVYDIWMADTAYLVSNGGDIYDAPGTIYTTSLYLTSSFGTMRVISDGTNWYAVAISGDWANI